MFFIIFSSPHSLPKETASTPIFFKAVIPAVAKPSALMEEKGYGISQTKSTPAARAAFALSNFVKSAKELYKGEGHGIEKHAGKILIGASALSSVVGVLNTLSSTHRPSRVSASDVIKKDEKYVVN